VHLTPPSILSAPILRAPILRALLALGLSGALSAGAIQLLWRVFQYDPPLLAKLALAGLFAAMLGAGLRLARGWLVGLALAPAALVGAMQLDLPGWAYLGLAVLGALVLFNSAGERVPLFLTGKASQRGLVDLIAPTDRVRVVDLGCGLGGPLFAMARANRATDSFFCGVETAPIPFAVAWVRAKLTGDPRVSIRFQSLWRVNLADFDLVYAFLSPAPMPRLMEKASQEMSPNAVLVSNEFTVEAYPADRIIVPDGAGGRPLHLWQAPIKAGLKRNADELAQ
jgi:SAM-dependent methyltransferase